METHNRFQSLDRYANGMNRGGGNADTGGQRGGHRGRGRARGRGNASAAPSRGRNHSLGRSASTDKSQNQNLRNNVQSTSNGVGAGRQPCPETKPRIIRPVGFKRLVEMLEKNSREVCLSLQDEGFGFYELLKSAIITNDLLVVIIKLLATSSECATCPQNRFALLNKTMSSHLYTAVIPRYLASASHDRTERLRLPQTMTNLMILFRQLLIAFPNKASDELGIAFVTCKDIIQRNATEGLGIDQTICADFIEIDDIRVNTLKKFEAPERNRNAEEESNMAQLPPDDFRTMAVTPTLADIHEVLNPFLRPNLVGSKYADVTHYLDVQFRLMREDFIAPLRDGLVNYLTLVSRGLVNKVHQRDIKLYNDVRISMPECSPFDGLAHRLNFNVEKLKRVNWEATRRLLYGSLVCLSSNNFHSFLLATVVKRDAKLLKDGFVNVRFILEDGQDSWNFNPNEVFTMIESPAYFEAYSPVLKGLQSITEETLPFQRYIINAATQVAAPAYLTQLTRFLFSPMLAPEIRETKPQYCQMLNDQSWPTAEDMQLDAAQYRALKMALTRELAIIQGPPGTGKTFLGLKIMELLVGNMEQWTAEPSPILVVCFTNHALDQFLEGILSFLPKAIVRVGGQSKCKALDPFNLNYLRKTRTSEKRVADYVHHSRARQYWTMGQIQREIVQKVDVMKVSEAKILHENDLKDFMNPRHYQQIQPLLGGFRKRPRKFVSVLQDWLGLLNVFVSNEEAIGGVPQPNAGPSQAQNVNQAEQEIFDEEDVLALEEMQNRMVDDYGGDELMEKIANAMRAEEAFNQFGQENEFSQYDGTIAFDPRDQEGQWQVQGGVKQMQKTIRQNMRKTDMMDDREVAQIRDVLELSYDDRWRLYRYWVSKMKAKKARDVEALQREYHCCFKRLQEVLKEIDIAILQEARVIGMTTTGAAKHRDVLQIVKPKIVIVEEAAEVLEAHIITALTKECQHLILIGDQQQLRPNPTVYKLAKDFNLDVSFFERQIKNGVAYERLMLQHRMRPRIAALLVPHIYPDLKNDPSVEKYEEVRGIDESVFFISHSHHEETVQDSTSRANNFEAQFLVALCRYLLLQGYESSQITILTTYLGQLFALKKLVKNTIVANVRCTVVDNYQGEENDIILLSLVRSNVDGQVGFLKVDNRICVALSRAKMGLYCIGNFDFLEANAPKWMPIVASMRRDGLVGPHLGLRCQNHPRTATLVATSADFDSVPEGGCQLPCEYRLPCGHQCPKACHAYDREHLQMQCIKKCDKILCASEHRCPKLCYQPCGQCTVMVSKRHPICGHDNMLQCYRDPSTAICRRPCGKILECGHPCSKECGNQCNRMNCFVKVQREAPCKHVVSVPCCQAEDSGILVKSCRNACEEILPCGHSCSGNCSLCQQGRMHVRCRQRCGRTLICSHSCGVPCAQNCPPCKQACENRCVHSKCPNRCGIPCKPCMEPCTWECPHYKCTKLCYEPCNRQACEHPCTEVLNCGHPCIGLCGEPCPPLCRECNKEDVCDIFFGSEDDVGARFVLMEDCGHVIEAAGMDKWMKESDPKSSIGMKTCPKCKTIIKRNLRYSTVIKKVLADVMLIKGIIFGNIKVIMKDAQKLKKDAEAIDIQDYRFKSCLQQVKKEITDSKQMGTNEIAVLRNKLQFLGVMEKLWKKNPDYVEPVPKKAKPEERHTALEEIFRDMQFAHQRVEVKKPELHDRNNWPSVNGLLQELVIWHQKLDPMSSDKEIYDFSRQLERVSRLSDFLMATKGRGMSTTGARACYNGIVELLVSTTPFSEQVEGHVKNEIVRLRVLMGGLGITEAEKIQIVKAIGLSKGHWFMCPNGHPYAIGECGGAMQEGRCPECNSPIGGQNHHLRSDNRLATQMDGASRWAYPGGLY